jgi:hypothetical protein
MKPLLAPKAIVNTSVQVDLARLMLTDVASSCLSFASIVLYIPAPSVAAMQPGKFADVLSLLNV